MTLSLSIPVRTSKVWGMPKCGEVFIMIIRPGMFLRRSHNVQEDWLVIKMSTSINRHASGSDAVQFILLAPKFLNTYFQKRPVVVSALAMVATVHVWL
jgi:hypothetical protein